MKADKAVMLCAFVRKSITGNSCSMRSCDFAQDDVFIAVLRETVIFTQTQNTETCTNIAYNSL